MEVQTVSDGNKLNPLIPLKDVLKDSPHIGMLSPANDTEVLEFFDSAAMSGGGFRLLMQRKPRFYDLFLNRGGQSHLAGMRDAQGKLIGTAAFTVTPCFVDQRLAKFAYLADLRVKCPDREGRKEWRECFGKVMKHSKQIAEMGPDSHLVCAIIETNINARRTLEEKDHGGCRLVQIAPYSMVTLMARLPQLKFARSNSPYTIERGASIEELESFLDSVHRKQAFGQCFAAPHFELRRRLKAWKGFSLEDFFTVRDEEGKILAATALWNPNQCKQTVIEGPAWTKAYNFVAQPFGLPQFAKPLEILYLTHLSFAWTLSTPEKHLAFNLLMDAVWPEKQKRQAHGIAFCDFKESALAPALQGYLKVPVNVGLYLVLPNEKIAEFTRSSLGLFPPAFEMALV